MKKTLSWLIAAIVLMSLAACGGGSEQSSPTVMTVQKADVTLTQVDSTQLVTPGETFRATLLKVGCPALVAGSLTYCEKITPLGEMGFEVMQDLQDLKVLYNGRELHGYFNREGTLYRFMPHERVEVYEVGSIELMATLPANAGTSGKSQVMVQVASASFDKTVDVVHGAATFEVYPIAHYAPAVIQNATSGFVSNANESDLAELAHFEYVCPQTVTMGCTLGDLEVEMYGTTAGSEMHVYVGGAWYLQQFASNESTMLMLNSGYIVGAGQSIMVQVYGQMKTGSVFFTKIGSKSGDKAIAVKLPNECTVVSAQYCKG